ncbi:tetratricopeptide repeat protein [Actinomadura sp. PM05-2]|uniref:Tetratricopeptide repeat protein n=1 Tax=Actinomadura parmotrematis TaxID=2864039 RepID=A0ABS7G2B2_9ACTN|nr:tetratricopeptide repeat protein [Actinomadura parmotrematis]
MAIAEEQGNPAREGYWLLELGQAHRLTGDLAAALAAFERSARIQHGIGDRARETLAWHHAAGVHHALGRHDEAIALLEQAAGLFRSIDAPWLEATSLAALADVQADADRPDLAQRSAAAARRLLDAFTDPAARALKERLAARSQPGRPGAAAGPAAELGEARLVLLGERGGGLHLGRRRRRARHQPRPRRDRLVQRVADLVADLPLDDPDRRREHPVQRHRARVRLRDLLVRRPQRLVGGHHAAVLEADVARALPGDADERDAQARDALVQHRLLVGGRDEPRHDQRRRPVPERPFPRHAASPGSPARISSAAAATSVAGATRRPSRTSTNHHAPPRASPAPRLRTYSHPTVTAARFRPAASRTMTFTTGFPSRTENAVTNPRTRATAPARDVR